MISRAILSAIFLFLTILHAEFYPDAAFGDDKVIMYFFWSDGCPHCEKEKSFLKTMQSRYPGLEIRSYEVRKDPDNAALFTRISEIYGISLKGVPATFIGGLPPVIGYRGEALSGREIEDNILTCIKDGCSDPMNGPGSAVLPEIMQPPSVDIKHQEGLCIQDAECPEETGPAAKAPLVTLPLIGAVDPARTALWYQTLIIAGLDSFNPCAFFVLITLLGLLIHVRSKRRMILIGGIFVFFSGFVYFIFMAAWLNIFLLSGKIAAVTTAAGAVALLIAGINIKDFFFFRRGVSLSIPESAKPKLFDRMRKLMRADSFPAIITGTVVLAVAANAYELFCTAGFPMVYTRILTLQNLSKSSYYLYLAFYNLIYVIPLALVVVFFASTMSARKLTEHQGQVLKLISGMMMLSLGVLLIAKPELLNNIAVTSGILVASLLLSGGIVYISGMLSNKDRKA